MKIVIGRDDLKVMPEVTKVLGNEDTTYRGLELDLGRYPKKKLNQLQAALKKYPGVKSAVKAVKDMETWLIAVDNSGAAKVTSITTLEPLMKLFLKDAPRHWLYRKDDDSGAWLAYYVSFIQYYPARIEERPYVVMTLCYEKFGRQQSTRIYFHASEVRGRTPPEILAYAGFYIESPELHKDYRQWVEKYASIFNNVGEQYIAIGSGETEESEGKNFWGRRWTYRQTVSMVEDGKASRVVIDDVPEEFRKANRITDMPTNSYWVANEEFVEGADEDGDDDSPTVWGDYGGADKLMVDPDKIDLMPVPLHPYLNCFDLKRHREVVLHVGQMVKYEYNTSLGDKLILPDEVRSLVGMLVSGKAGGFRDIVENKSGGSVILCCGSPGTGKTLTAEVFSEHKSKPLYAVQCGQLGLDAEEVEESLRKVFKRAARWGAILLLDEADVYIGKRGNDLKQNAVVSVFLRVMEGYEGILFMTTNRAETIDDAIASRCLAKIDYSVPTEGDQKRIWRVLADTSGIELADAEIAKVVKLWKLSGRDVKNLLKLGSMAAKESGKPLTAEVIQFVKRFKPTQDIGE